MSQVSPIPAPVAHAAPNEVARGGPLPSRPGPGHHTRIGPESSWLLDPREIWQYRELLWKLAGRDLKVSYKQTVLGVAWVVLQPLTTASILSFVFGTVLKLPFPRGIPLLFFIFAAFTGFNPYHDIVNMAGTSLVGNRPLISKIYFPRVLLQ